MMSVNFFENLFDCFVNNDNKEVRMYEILPEIKNLQNDYEKYSDCFGQEYYLKNGDKVYSVWSFDEVNMLFFVDKNNLCKVEIITKLSTMTSKCIFLDKKLDNETIGYLGNDLNIADSTVYYNGNFHSNIQTITDLNNFIVCEKILFNGINDCDDIRSDLLGYKRNDKKVVILYSNGSPYYACYNGFDHVDDNKYHEFSQNCVNFVNEKYQEIYNVIGYSYSLDEIKRKELKK